MKNNHFHYPPITDGPWPINSTLSTSTRMCPIYSVSESRRFLLLLQLIPFQLQQLAESNVSLPFSSFSPLSRSPSPSRPSARCNASCTAFTPPPAGTSFGGGGGRQKPQSSLLAVSVPTLRHRQPSAKRNLWWTAPQENVVAMRHIAKREEASYGVVEGLR